MYVYICMYVICIYIYIYMSLPLYMYIYMMTTDDSKVYNCDYVCITMYIAMSLWPIHHSSSFYYDQILVGHKFHEFSMTGPFCKRKFLQLTRLLRRHSDTIIYLRILQSFQNNYTIKFLTTSVYIFQFSGAIAEMFVLDKQPGARLLVNVFQWLF